MRSNVTPLFDTPTAHTEAQPGRFDEFWQSYPKHVGKALAKAKYTAIVKGGFRTRTLDKDSGQFVEIELEATEQELIDGAKAYTRSLLDLNTYKRKIEDKFIPGPAVWLNQGRWMDGE